MSELITLALDRQRATFDPLGAALASYTLGTWSVIWGREGGRAVAGEGDVLMPFPSRLAHGRYVFDETVHQLEPNDAESPHAIHGFLREVRWQVTDQTAWSVRFETTNSPTDRAGYPFGLRVAVTYALSSDGLRTSFAVTNVGDTAAPFAAGFHPYFSFGGVVDEIELSLPATTALEFDGFLPTGRRLDVASTALDFRRSRAIGTARIGACFADLQREARGRVTVSLKPAGGGNRRISLHLDQAFEYVVVYTGDAVTGPWRRRALAVEPLTSGTDAFNQPELGLRRLEPGQTFSGSYEIQARD